MMRALVVASLLGMAQSSPWKAYLASHNAASFDYSAACKALSQGPSGMGSSSSGGKTTYSITCDEPVKVVCTSSSCTSDYIPAATAADSPPTGKYNVKAAGGGQCGGFDADEVQLFLNLHNKMRCAVGAPPIKWDPKLECQAQKTQESIGAFTHSKSYGKPIPAGENLATGNTPAGAAWMWFTEYTQSQDYAHGGETGHYSAMVWKSDTTVGCGVGKHDGKSGVVRCQYTSATKANLPNMAGAYGDNLNKFDGNPGDFKKCGIPVAEVKNKCKKYKGWGILNPTGTMASNLGLYSIEETMWSSQPVSVLAAGGCVLAAALGLVVVSRRLRRQARAAPLSENSDSELQEIE